ncbi:hypothetical protein SISNIDRAFT_487446 [Sistotremastrum niveocremeum HHB9708]|uniref:Uncharacterized protein n=1 Tax=Sistotremastrum niveocremeum HHB9708 TaxID=1314777 RepID=A0A164SH29_9AGAM|nr:hypothetical protein SISNIDRAFT_487446 [Sistotremastrum niveocremeum HHB9708]
MSAVNRPILLTLQIVGGHVGLPILLVTFCFVKRKRSMVVIHFCISWIIFSISGSLQSYTPIPLHLITSQGLCLLSQAADDGATIMTALSTLSLLLNLYLCLVRPSWFVNPNYRPWIEKAVRHSLAV